MATSRGPLCWLINRDTVRLWLDTFPHQRHGELRGHLRLISSDTFSAPGGQQDSRTPLQQVIYRATATVIESALYDLPESLTEARRLPGALLPTASLRPGLTGTAHIKTGRRRLVSYFLDPLYRGIQESCREPR